MATNLRLQWYNALVVGCNLSPKTFRLVDGSVAVGTTSDPLWGKLDAVPQGSSNPFYQADPSNLFSDLYGAILGALTPATTVVKKARDLLESSGGPGSVRPYSKTIDDLTQALSGAPSFIFQTKSSPETAAAKLSGTASSSPSLAALVSTSTGQSIDLQEVAQTCTIQIQAAFDRLTVLVAGPLARENPRDPILNQYKPWYSSPALLLAYQDPSSWARSEDRDLYFGKSGSLLRRANSLVVVDGVKVSIRIQDPSRSNLWSAVAAQPGTVTAWPFAALSTATVLAPKSAGDEAVIEIESSAGNPLILGANVLPLSDSLSL